MARCCSRSSACATRGPGLAIILSVARDLRFRPLHAPRPIVAAGIANTWTTGRWPRAARRLLLGGQAGVRHRCTRGVRARELPAETGCDLEWIRAAMRSVNLRVATRCPWRRRRQHRAQASSGWIGDDTPAGQRGQLATTTRSRGTAQPPRAPGRVARTGCCWASACWSPPCCSWRTLSVPFGSGHSLLPPGPRHYLMWCHGAADTICGHLRDLHPGGAGGPDADPAIPLHARIVRFRRPTTGRDPGPAEPCLRSTAARWVRPAWSSTPSGRWPSATRPSRD